LLDNLENLPQSMILISHDREVCARLAQRSIVLVDGQLIPA